MMEENNIEIEFFLKRTLNVKPGSKADSKLHGFFSGIVLYEKGYGVITPSQHKESFDSYLKYFERAIDRLSKKHVNLASNASRLKEQMQQMTTSSQMIWLYDEIQRLTK